MEQSTLEAVAVAIASGPASFSIQDPAANAARAGDTYFPIELSLPGSKTDQEARALSEEQKRKRFIIGLGSLIAVTFLLIIVMSKR